MEWHGFNNILLKTLMILILVQEDFDGIIYVHITIKWSLLIYIFQNLRKELTLHKMDTLSLIEAFYMEKNEQQVGIQKSM